MNAELQETDRLRLDELLVRRGLFASRSRARDAIERGTVRVAGAVAAKPGQSVPASCDLEIDDPAKDYVSRAALKLIAGLDHFAFDPAGAEALDVGASTGGFTQVLLERGARRVYAVDVGRGQLHASLRVRPEIVSLEETDIRTLSPALLPEPPDLVVVDVSFISLKLVLPPALALARPPAQLIALIKPQFEAGRAHLKKGVVRDPQVHQAICEDILAFVAGLGWNVRGIIPSPVTGGNGNREFLLGARNDV